MADGGAEFDRDVITAVRFLRANRLPESEANIRVCLLALSLATGEQREQVALRACATFFRRLSELAARS